VAVKIGDEQPHPLYRVGLLLRPVDALHRPVAAASAARLDGVARVWASHDEPDPFVVDAVAIPEARRPELRVEWQPVRGTDYEVRATGGMDPRIRAILDTLDGGPAAAAAGDPVAILAAEVRRLWGPAS
jgi:hypothetical protein